MKTMRMAISGAGGLVGSFLRDDLTRAGHTVIRIVRSATVMPGGEDIIRWNIAQKQIETEKLEGLDAVIHLAGANIAARRWSKTHKAEILRSRIDGTTLLALALAKLRNPPKVLLCASAIGFYGPRPADQAIDENSSPGVGFLSDVCVAWEKAAQVARQQGIRVVSMRFGMILSAQGGALARMLPIFKMGLGGKLGHGQQMISWIALEEIPPVILQLINHAEISGPVNVVAPAAVSNAVFTKILGEVIHRPTVFPVPAVGIKLLFGQMGEELLLSGAHVVPQRLLQSGYQFIYPDLKGALENSFKRK